VLVIGGNGTVHEVVNGYMLREDRDMMNLRIGTIATGEISAASGKACEDFKLSRAPDVINSLYALTRSRLRPITVFEYENDGPEPLVYGFHSFGVGLPAQVVLDQNAARKKSNKPYPDPQILKYSSSVRKMKYKIWSSQDISLGKKHSRHSKFKSSTVRKYFYPD